MSKKYEHLIVRRPINVNELPHHELGQIIPFPVLMGKALVPEANAWALYVFIKEITPEMIEALKRDEVGKAVLHKHRFDEMYLMIGEEEAITFEVTLGSERYEVKTPAAVYIPAGTPHGIRPIAGTVGKTGGLIPVCLSGEYITEDV